MDVGTIAITIDGGIGVDLGAICVIAYINLIGFALPLEKKGRLDTEQHAGEQKCRKAELPGTDPRSQDQLGGDHRPERLREDQSEGVSKWEILEAGKLEEQAHSRADSLKPGEDTVWPGAWKKRGCSWCGEDKSQNDCFQS